VRERGGGRGNVCSVLPIRADAGRKIPRTKKRKENLLFLFLQKRKEGCRCASSGIAEGVEQLKQKEGKDLRSRPCPLPSRKRREKKREETSILASLLFSFSNGRGLGGDDAQRRKERKGGKRKRCFFIILFFSREKGEEA